VIVAIKQRYAGHARQAALAAMECRAGAFLGRYVVVDEDIAITDTHDVLWAMCTRVDPEKDLEIIRRMWSSPLDPIIPPAQKGLNSRAIFDATYEWKDQFPGVGDAHRLRVESAIEPVPRSPCDAAEVKYRFMRNLGKREGKSILMPAPPAPVDRR
jgi:4-hydroxy-3-polyprenylbenzoate decarboxylase